MLSYRDLIKYRLWYRHWSNRYGPLRHYGINRRTLEVHSYGCPYFPEINELYLGYLGSLRQATERAKRRYSVFADPCYYCELREYQQRRRISRLLSYL